MTPVRILTVQDAVAAAERVLVDPNREAMRISIDERVTLCALVLQQHQALLAHGIPYPKRPADAAQLEAAE